MSNYKINDPFWNIMQKTASFGVAKTLNKILSFLDKHPKTSIGLGALTGTGLGLEGLDRAAGGSGVLTSLFTGEKHNPNWVQRAAHDFGRDVGKLSLTPLAVASSMGDEQSSVNLVKALKAIDELDKKEKATWRPLYS